jgi:hypothetical protein
MESSNTNRRGPNFTLDGYEATYKNFLKQIRAELNTGNGFPEFLADMKVEGMQAVSPVLHKYAI